MIEIRHKETGQVLAQVEGEAGDAAPAALRDGVMLNDSALGSGHFPDIFVVMSNDGYEKHASELKDDAVIVYERDLVHPEPRPGQVLPTAIPRTSSHPIQVPSRCHPTRFPGPVLPPRGLSFMSADFSSLTGGCCWRRLF